MLTDWQRLWNIVFSFQLKMKGDHGSNYDDDYNDNFFMGVRK